MNIFRQVCWKLTSSSELSSLHHSPCLISTVVAISVPQICKICCWVGDNRCNYFIWVENNCLVVVLFVPNVVFYWVTIFLHTAILNIGRYFSFIHALSNIYSLFHAYYYSTILKPFTQVPRLSRNLGQILLLFFKISIS